MMEWFRRLLHVPDFNTPPHWYMVYWSCMLIGYMLFWSWIYGKL